MPALMGSGLVFAGITDRCGLALVLARLRYNRPASCDVDAMVRALTRGTPSPAADRGETSGGSAGCAPAAP